MTRGEVVRLGGALLLGAGMAFPVALMVTGEREPEAAPARPAAERRAMFSPRVRGDPYVLDQLRGQVEALEAHCNATGELCAEARGGRSRYDELAAER